MCFSMVHSWEDVKYPLTSYIKISNFFRKSKIICEQYYMEPNAFVAKFDHCSLS
jgi:hypothetical protein